MINCVTLAGSHSSLSSCMESGRLQFGRFVVDLDRGSLCTDDGTEIALRPKTFAVLVHLVSNAGRLVSKDELFAALWPRLVVTDDTLVQSIGELRRALGDDGAALIRTVPRRGYRFESKAARTAPPDARDAAPPQPEAPYAPASPQAPAADAASARSTESGAPNVAPPSAARTPSAARRIAIASALIGGLVVAGVVLWSDGMIGGDYARSGADVSPPAQRVAHTKATIAILPFANRSDDASREYFADGLTQDVINALGRFSELTVMSWNAVQPYKGNPVSPGEIARKLGSTTRSRAACSRPAIACA